MKLRTPSSFLNVTGFGCFDSNYAAMSLALYRYALSLPLVMYYYSEVVFTHFASQVGSPFDSDNETMKILTDYRYVLNVPENGGKLIFSGSPLASYLTLSGLPVPSATSSSWVSDTQSKTSTEYSRSCIVPRTKSPTLSFFLLMEMMTART